MSAESKKEYAEALDHYEALVSTNPEIERKGATMPYTSKNGHMFSFLTKEARLALRLPAGEREEFLEQFNTDLCVQHGAVMKEYVVVPEDLLKDTAKLAHYFNLSYAYVKSLTPKPSKKKSKK